MSALTFVPGNVWVLSQRCYQDKPLLKDAVDRRRWLYWLFQARRRFGLSVLNYVVLPNEIQLLVMDRRRGEIRSSMQMLAEQMTADYNRRHQRKKPLWEGEYQASRLELGGNGLMHCISDMDLSLVRAKLVTHPNLWPECGYHELHNPPSRARRIDFTALQRLLNPLDFSRLQTERRRWVKRAMKLAASDAVYVPHASVQSNLHSNPHSNLSSGLSSKRSLSSNGSSITLPLTFSRSGQPSYLTTPVHSAKPELVPKRYIS